MNKEQKRFWHILSTKYPKNQNCYNCKHILVKPGIGRCKDCSGGTGGSEKNNWEWSGAPELQLTDPHPWDAINE